MTSVAYDIVLYGATGFTGSLVAQYLASHPQQPSIAFAGRNEGKIRKVIANLIDIPKTRAERIGVVTASSTDAASLKRMAQTAKVIINTVGPYGDLGGFEVAQAAAQNGCGYVDLTGESNVYERVAKELHSVAQSTKAILVPSVGFDSLPFDLTTYLAIQQVKDTAGDATEIDTALCGYKVMGSMSGGTAASFVAMTKYPDIVNYKLPYLLSPIQGAQRLHSYFARKLPQFGGWGGYSPFAPHNTRVVNRTWGLLQLAGATRQYGKNFSYVEGFKTPNRITSVLLSCFFLGLCWVAIHVKLLGSLLRRAIPQGTGSPMEKQLKGFADVRTLATSADGKTKALSSFKFKGDPGYLRTATMISETALALALNRNALSPLAQQGGVHTSATIGGEVVRDRLVQYGGFHIVTADVSHVVDLSKAAA
ncbi:hypothetical protein MVES1_000230 [Malassezia vespertilionis]|uniref:Saccharopine dehydrogenase NADP binding domain-containing protein n=1 Tax=Malassezia vespertilionis TaxID=2020962 RepID=A0A2N1JG53_9BASI|nr:uncharacterized protein MVES1_000230 [Malassezia vespertilionis]PKI85527.1 hypothetical protein MVES_000219 [Malassezia vespertilionis]WFD04905.1 hypothetical protein MVES1_000230 [Malassezia vespertilionis]